jgi:hypothetical protein
VERRRCSATLKGQKQERNHNAREPACGAMPTYELGGAKRPGY